VAGRVRRVPGARPAALSPAPVCCPCLLPLLASQAGGWPVGSQGRPVLISSPERRLALVSGPPGPHKARSREASADLGAAT